MKLGNKTSQILFVAAFVVALYTTSWYSYLLFHTIVEIFSVIVAGSIFILAWNTRRWMDNSYFLFVGVAFLFVGIIDFLHALAYKGMNIFEGFDANLPTQLWILARYIQSISLLIAAAFLGRRLRPGVALTSYFLVSSLFLGLIFTNNFPACYVEGVGLTEFKVISEYIIILILAISAVLVFGKRNTFEPGVMQAFLLFIAVMVGAELAFTAYFGVYDAANIDFDGEPCLLVGLADITEQKRAQEGLEHLSTHDALTGVYNRTYFEAEMERLQKGRGFPVSIIVLDTDDLKVINDT